MKKSYVLVYYVVLIILSLFASSVVASSTPWLDAKEYSGIVYLLFDSPARIERYDMATQSWLTDITLSDTPTAFAIDSNALFISFGRRTSRFSIDGSGESHLCNTNYDVRSLLINKDFLYVYDGTIFLSVNKNTGNLIDSQDYWYTMQGLTVAPGIGMVFARSTGVSPSDILQITLNNDGTLGAQKDSPYHGDYPSAVQTYIFPNEARVADNSGIVYNSNNMTYSNSLAGSFDDLAFYGDLPVVLRNNELIAYSNAFLETGRYTPADPPAAIFIYGENVFSFFPNGAEAAVAVIPVSLLSPSTPGDPVDPTGLAYTPDNIILGQDEIIYLLSQNNLSIFRWSVAQRDYIDTIPLLAAPKYMAYSSDINRLYLAYPTNQITEIRPAQGIAETPFVNSPQEPQGLATAGSYVFVYDPSGAWGTHFTYSPEGALISQKDWNYFSKEYIWNAANQKMYFFRDDTSPNDLLWEDIASNGVIGDYKDSPYHSSDGIQHPLRVAPDGSKVVLGSGRIYDAVSLEQVNSLSNNIVDAAWKNGSLITLRSFNGNTQVQEWTSTYGIKKAQQVSGGPHRLFPVNEGLLVITEVAGVPRFNLLSCNESNNAPEIAVSGNSVSIPDDDTTPSADDHTEFGSVTVGAPVSKTYTITNSGNADLHLTGTEPVTLVDAGCAEFSVIIPPTTSVAAAGGSTSFTLQYNPAKAGEDVCAVLIKNDDCDESPYNFVVRGEGVAAPEPEIAVKGNGISIVDGDATPSATDHTDFANAAIGASVSKIYTITNSGNADLHLTGSEPVTLDGTDCAEFSVTTQPATPVATTGGSTTFTLQYSPVDQGGDVCSVVIANDDSDENPYNFAVNGTGVKRKIAGVLPAIYKLLLKAKQ